MLGELDLFQKEHEMSTLLAKCGTQSSSTSNDKLVAEGAQPADILLTNCLVNCNSTDEVDLAAAAAAAFSSRLYGDCTDTNNGGASTGFENPTFRYMDSTSVGQEIVLMQDNQLLGVTQRYLQDHSEIVTLRCKDHQPKETNCTSIGIGGMGNDATIRAVNTSNGASSSKTNTNSHQQRMSSFKADSLSPSTSQPPSSGGSNLKRTHSQNCSAVKLEVHQTPNNNYHCSPNDGNGYNNEGASPYNNGRHMPVTELTEQAVVGSPDEKIRTKPVVSPRPASLSGLLL